MIECGVKRSEQEQYVSRRQFIHLKTGGQIRLTELKTSIRLSPSLFSLILFFTESLFRFCNSRYLNHDLEEGWTVSRSLHCRKLPHTHLVFSDLKKFCPSDLSSNTFGPESQSRDSPTSHPSGSSLSSLIFSCLFRSFRCRKPSDKRRSRPYNRTFRNDPFVA